MIGAVYDCAIAPERWGKGPADIAPALGIAMSMPKTHVVHIFGKTGCRLPADLVQRATSVALPLSLRDLPPAGDVIRPGR
ncbi:hypothetical protein [Chelatococcus reniformis]|uniref:hypothetical protein n=1 Tax=Chelatococcus reniformis TaxID=1494448 RepID=UPI0016669A40|nr:hypothetical protein [Chelatococcus reniformis]